MQQLRGFISTEGQHKLGQMCQGETAALCQPVVENATATSVLSSYRPSFMQGSAHCLRIMPAISVYQ